MNSSSAKSLLSAHGFMVLTMVLVASSFPVGAAITNELDPAIMMFIRFSLATAFFAPYVFIKNGMAFPPKKQLFRYGILSVPLVIFFWCMFESLRFTSALNTGALYTSVPAITAVYALFINQEKVGKVRSLGLFLGTIGALWIIFRGDLNALMSMEFNKGDLIFLTGCFFLGIYGPLVKRFYQNEPMEVMTFWTLFAGCIWFFVFSGEGLWKVDWAQVEQKVYMGVLYLAFFTTLCTFFLLQYCTVRLGPIKVSAYSFLTPIFVILIINIIGMGEFELATLPGILLVVVSMGLVQREVRVKPQFTPQKRTCEPICPSA